MKKKICCVVQRYGLEVNGGAETHCRNVAEKLLARYEVDVLTTKATDYMTWKDVYREDKEDINGVHVYRFGVRRPRNIDAFNSINARFLERGIAQSEERDWIEEQGPIVPELIEYIRNHKNDYDAFIFFTYLYYPSVLGVREVYDKAIVLPLAHDQPDLKMKIFEDVFASPRALFYNTEEERTLVEARFHNEHVPSLIGGVGVDLPDDIDGERFKKKYDVDNYVVYVGRIDEGKNWSELFDFFRRYKQSHRPSDLKLVTIGKSFIDVIDDPDIIHLGFLEDDGDKFDGIKGARALLLPSKFESLSAVVLEAMTVETPTLVNGWCEVLKAHCTKSGGGCTTIAMRSLRRH